MTTRALLVAVLGAVLVLPAVALASQPRELILTEALTDPRAVLCLIVFVLSYALVMTEEQTTLRKSKPVMLGAGIIWAIVAWGAPDYGVTHEQLREAIFHDLDEYGSLMLFLMAAMTYIAALEAANVFAALRSWMVGRGFTYKQLFWVGGTIAFFLSAVADNLTTALVMGAVIMALGVGQPRFVAISFVGVVSAANAGGAFSPFGDITTLMVWQSGRIEFVEFFALFVPSLAVFLVPQIIMTPFIPTGAPPKLDERVAMRRGARAIIALGLLTIVMAVSFEQFLGLPPFMGMMTGMALLMVFTYYLRQTLTAEEEAEVADVFSHVRNVEWDTLLFFFGVMFSVGGLAFIGYLEVASGALYQGWGATAANITVGVASAIVDNIPVMFAVLSMQPDMPHFQWLLVTLTCGVGGSLLSVGSAAGVALMGTSKGQYTFGSHLRWTPVIALGYAAGIGVHFLVNG